MGLDHCTKCKEYYNPCSTYDYNLSIQNFNNPFFPRRNETGSNKEKDFLNMNNNTNNNIQGTNEEEKEKNIRKEITENAEKKKKNETNFININNENAE